MYAPLTYATTWLVHSALPNILPLIILCIHNKLSFIPVGVGRDTLRIFVECVYIHGVD